MRINNFRIQTLRGVCPIKDDTIKLTRVALKFPAGRVLDMGTGTGFIGLMLSSKGFKVDAVDNSPVSLENAKINSKRNGLKINIFHSNLFQSVKGTYDLIIFNPPLNPDEGQNFQLFRSLIRNVSFVENIALPIGKNLFKDKRLDFLYRFINESRKYLNHNGNIILSVSSEEVIELERRDDINSLQKHTSVERKGQIFYIISLNFKDKVEVKI